MSFVEKVEQWNREIAGSFDRAFSDLRRELQERLRESHQDLDRRIEAYAPPLPVLAHEDLAPAADRLRGEARAGAHDELRDALAAVDRARSQSAVLAALVAGAARFASRAALLLSRGGELRGWGGQGFGDAEHRLADVTLAAPAGSPWGRVAAAGEHGAAGAAGAAGDHGAAGPAQLSAAECAVLCGQIESPVPAFGVLVPLVLRDRTVAVLYADQLPEAPDRAAAAGQAGALSLPALQTLVYVAALAIESLPFRQREATATLQPVGGAEETGVPAVAAAATAAAAATPAAPAPAAGEGIGERIAEAPAEGAAAAGPAVALAAATMAAEAAVAPSVEPVAEPGEPAVAPGAEAAMVGAAAAPGIEKLAGPGTSAAAETAPAAASDTLPESPASAAGTAGAESSLGAAGAPKETAEIPAPRPLRPVPPLSPAAPPASPASETETASVPSGESPYLDEAAASGAPAAATPPAPGIGAAASGAASGDHETVLLPRTGLRDAAGLPWGRRGAEAAPGVGAQGLAGVPAIPAAPETPTAPETLEIGEVPAPIAPIPPMPTDTQVPAGTPHGPAGLGTLRAVPSVPPLAAAGPGSPVSTAGTNPGTVLPPPTLTPVPPASPFFEPVRTGPLGSGTPEVRPPSGVQGPGWAFATTRIQASSSEEALHEEARRLARLLVSEIKLYNEEQVEAGRRNRDIYERLREDIDRSRQMYEERVEPRLVKSTDYFYQELVRILAAGDSKALGI